METKKLDNYNLNNSSHLNPDLNVSEKRDKLLKDWENKPFVKDNDFGAYDKRKQITLNKTKLGFFKFLSTIGILAFLIIAISFGIMGYIVFKDGSLKSITNLTCQAQTVNIDKGICPTQTCGNCNCANIICPTVNLTCPTVNCNYNGS